MRIEMMLYHKLIKRKKKEEYLIFIRFERKKYIKLSIEKIN
jgi:hypothetical protein